MVIANTPARQKIAIIGGGISGMGAAYELAPTNHVTLFEADNRLGGHARTVIAGKNNNQPVDTGFIVFNHANYPHLVRLFTELNVPTTKSSMSFGASLRGGEIEYALRDVKSIFAQRRNALNPKFLRMLYDIYKFNTKGLKIAQDQSMTVGTFLEKLGTGTWFRDFYLLPLSGAIWSTPAEKMLDFPAYAMLQFFENHALLSHTGQHQWYTVTGGSTEYVGRLHNALIERDVDVQLSTPVAGVKRLDKKIEISTYKNAPQLFDQVIFATHSDDALALLTDPTTSEQRNLGAIKYQPNDIVLHCDDSLMPKHRTCWSSWVYCEDKNKNNERIDLTYWMNSLQPIPMDDPHFVTLNTTRDIDETKIYDRVTLRHPLYDLEALNAQARIKTMNGQKNTWFCGAWMKNGFHEDGLSSAIEVARKIIDNTSMQIAAQ